MWWRKTAQIEPKVCHECNVEEGALHELFCPQEECPFCLDQLAGCECIKSVLTLTPEECQVVDEYLDDSIEPLRTIISRWQHALEKMGRVRFVDAPILCRRCGTTWPPFFRVPDEEWRRFVPVSLQRDVLCQECYTFVRTQVESHGG